MGPAKHRTVPQLRIAGIMRAIQKKGGTGPISRLASAVAKRACFPMAPPPVITTQTPTVSCSGGHKGTPEVGCLDGRSCTPAWSGCLLLLLRLLWQRWLRRGLRRRLWWGLRRGLRWQRRRLLRRGLQRGHRAHPRSGAPMIHGRRVAHRPSLVSGLVRRAAASCRRRAGDGAGRQRGCPCRHARRTSDPSTRRRRSVDS